MSDHREESDQSFHDFINEILESVVFDWFGLLGYSVEHMAERKKWESMWEDTDPEHRNWKPAPETAEKCLEAWRNHLAVENLLAVKQVQPNGDVRFYVLVQMPFRDYGGELVRVWKQYSNGWAYHRDPMESVAGFFGHLVMRAGGTLIVNCGIRRGRFTQENFRPWKPKI